MAVRIIEVTRKGNESGRRIRRVTSVSNSIQMMCIDMILQMNADGSGAKGKE